MREAEEIEYLGFPLSKRRTLLGRMAAKADQPGLVRVQRQFERAHSLVQIVQKGLCLVLMLKTDDLVKAGLIEVIAILKPLVTYKVRR